MKTVKVTLGCFLALILAVVACCFGGSWVLSRMDVPPPEIIFENTNKANPDVASFQNCRWDQFKA